MAQPNFKNLNNPNKVSNASREEWTLTSHRNSKSRRSARFVFFRAAYSPKEYIQFWVNPHDCVWHTGTRTSVEKIQGGAVHHEWIQRGTNRNTGFKDSRFDQPTISFAFQSASLDIDNYKDIGFDNKYNSSLTPGVGNFYDFTKMLGESDMTKNGSPNYINILYKSPLMGKRGIHLEGFFTDEGVNWTESAEQNQLMNWGATFMVFNCSPSLYELRSNWQNPDIYF